MFGIGLIAALAVTAGHVGAAGKVMIVQSNSAGDSVTLIDPTIDKVVAEIPGIEVGHGVAPSPDGSRLYVTNESLMTVDVVDMATLSVIKRIPLTGPPNNIAVRKDGQRVYAAITGAAGGVDIIDTAKLEKIKFIRVLGGVHNPIMTPDSKYVVRGSTGGSWRRSSTRSSSGRSGRFTSAMAKACACSASRRIPTARPSGCSSS